MDESRQDLEQLNRMQAGVREALSKVGGVRGASRGTLLTMLCVAALAPVVAAAAGTGAVVAAGMGVLGSVGANILTTAVIATVDSLRARGQNKPSVDDVAAELSQQLEAVLVGGGTTEASLRDELIAVWSQVGIARVAVQVAVATGNEELHKVVVSGLGQLSSEFSGVVAILTQVQEAADNALSGRAGPVK